MRTTSGCRGRVLCALVWTFILGGIALSIGAPPALGDEPVGAGRLDGGKRGAVRRWGAGMAVGPYSEVNLKTGRVLTTLPVVGWSGVGPAVSFSLYHNQPLWADPTGPTTPSMLGDANFDGGVDAADTEDFIDVLMDPEPDAEAVAVCDFDRNESADEMDLGRFGALLASGEADVGRWSHSYSRHLDLSNLPDWLIVVWDDGTEDVYEPDGVGGWTPPPGVFNALSDDGAGGYRLTSKHRDLMRFDESGRLDWVEDAAGNRLTCAYGQTVGAPDYRKLIYVTDAANRSLTLQYNDHGLLETITDPISRAWTCLYEDAAHPGEPSSEADGPFVRFTDPGGSSVNWAYDDGAIVALWDPSLDPASDDPWAYVFDGEQLTTVTDPLGLTQSFAYWPDAYPRPTRIQARYTDRRGSLWRYWIKYSTGNLERWIDPLNHEQRFTYGDARPQLSHERTAYRNAASKTWTAAYDDVANVDFAADPLGNAWTFAYDGVNNLTSVTPPGETPGTGNADKIVAYIYGDANFPTSVTGITLPADGQGNPATTIGLTYWGQAPEDPATSYGLLKSVTDANGVGTLYEYDDYGELRRTSEGPLAEYETTWLKVVERQFSNEVGWLQGSTRNEEPLRNPSPGSPPEDNPSRWAFETICGTFNILGLIEVPCCCGILWCVSGPCDPNEQFECPYRGDLQIEQREAAMSWSSCPSYNVNGTMQGPSHFSYDPMRRPVRIDTDFTDSSLQPNTAFNVSLQVAYDALGRPTANDLLTDEPTWRPNLPGQSLLRTFLYDYNDVDGIYERTGPDDQVTHVETDAAGRLTLVTRGQLSAQYTYHDDDAVATETFGNGTRAVYTYDDAGRVVTIRHERVADASLILELGYTYSADGLILGVDETAPSSDPIEVTYHYDNRNRLIYESRIVDAGGGFTREYELAYTYDQGGNRLTKSDHVAHVRVEYHYDLEDPATYRTQNNRLMYEESFDISDPQDPMLLERIYYEYNDNQVGAGNVTRVIRAPGLGPGPAVYHATDLQYNRMGELWFAIESHWDMDDPTCEERVVDRILEFRGSGRARYLVRQRNVTNPKLLITDSDIWSDYDGDTIYGDYTVDEETGTVTPLASYLPGVGQVDEATGVVYYYHADHLGSARAVTSAGGGVVERIVHTAFGEPVTRMGIALTPTRYLYAGAWGYESDLGAAHAGGSTGDTALPYQHLGFRWYDPASGRFLQRDPIGINGGLNQYDYVSSLPTELVDPSGLIVPPEGATWPPRVRSNEERKADYEVAVDAAPIAVPLATAPLAGPLLARCWPFIVSKIGPKGDWIRWGMGYIKKGATEKQWRIAFGGKKSWIHGHIHAENWDKPWRWVQRLGKWKCYD